MVPGFACIAVLSSNTPACLLSSSARFRFPIILATDTGLSLAALRSSPRVLLYSSPPSFTCRWAEEQYAGGHGDRQPPPCGLFLLLFLVLLLLGSCTLLSRHAGRAPAAWLGLRSWENRTLKFMHQSGEPWETCVQEFKLMFMTGFLD